MVLTSYGRPALGAFLLIAALFHVANHGAYKTLLFLEAGVVEHATGTRDMDRLGGLVRTLPRTAVVSLVGTLGIAPLPPLNGFVSEWLVFQGLFQGFRISAHVIGILIVLAAALLGLTAGTPVVLTGLDHLTHATTGIALGSRLLIEHLTVIPAHTDFSAFSPTYLAVFLIAILIVPLAIYHAGRPRAATRIEPVWDGGILAFKPACSTPR